MHRYPYAIRLVVAAVIIVIAGVSLGCPKSGQPGADGKAGGGKLQAPTLQENIPAVGSQLTIGAKFPMFAASASDGKILDLQSLLGPKTYVLVWFWATWTNPDAPDLAALSKALEAHPGDRFRVACVNVDLKSHQPQVEALIKAGGYAFPIATDYNHTDPATLTNAYNLGAGKTPPNYLLGPDGTILMSNIKAADVDAIVTSLLATQDIYKPIMINVNVTGTVEPAVPGTPPVSSDSGATNQKAPESVIFSTSISNPGAEEDKDYEAALTYRVLKPTGQSTFLKIYPDDPMSDLISTNGQPILFKVVQGKTVEFPNLVKGSETEFVLDLPLDSNTFVVEYWGAAWSFVLNRLVPGDRGKKDFAQVPYCTTEAVDRQGGPIAAPGQ
jgi:peroxiredoxin